MILLIGKRLSDSCLNQEEEFQNEPADNLLIFEKVQS